MKVHSHMSPRVSVFLLAALLSVMGCAGTAGAPVPPSGDDKTIRIVGEHQADLLLWVSNQSFIDDPVSLTVRIDDAELIAQPFHVEGQHNWLLFPIKVSPGRHLLTAESDTGAEVRKRFMSPESGRRYAVVDYWNYEGDRGPHLSWTFQSTPVAFA